MPIILDKFALYKRTMRDKRFVAERQGGPLSLEQHHQLIKWACQCVENVWSLLGEDKDERIETALRTAKEWAEGTASVGDARKASVDVIAFANESTDQIAVAVARAAGHAVATAHMADHSLEAAMYSLKAVKNAGKSIDLERRWQNNLLPEEVRAIVLSARRAKESHFKL